MKAKKTITVYVESGCDDVHIIHVRGASNKRSAEKAAEAHVAGCSDVTRVTTDLNYLLARSYDGVDEANIKV